MAVARSGNAPVRAIGGHDDTIVTSRIADPRADPVVEVEVAILVIGAGPTGIGAARRLQEEGADWMMVEAGGGPGGMASSVTDEYGFTWDLGGHVLHSHFADFDSAIKDSGVRLLYPMRNGRVWMNGVLFPAPIQHQVAELPTDLDPDGPADDLADYYRNHLGTALLDAFFRPFTEKMWATPLERIDHGWTSLRNGSAARNVPTIQVRSDRPTANTVTFPYPAGGTGVLWDRIAAGLDQRRISYDSPVRAIDLDGHVAILDSGRRIRFDACISSMPLTALLAMVDRPELEALAPDLISNETLVIGMGLEGSMPPGLEGTSWLYCPDADVPWHRATMLSHYDPANAGDGRWSILFEVGRSDFRVVDTAEAIAGCRRSLVDLGADPAALVSTWVRTVPLGYPVPTLGRDPLLHRIDDQLRAAGIRSRGRFGGWRYESCNQDYSFAQGVEAAAAILHGTAEDVYWHPELSS